MIDVPHKDEPAEIPGWQKQEVHKRIKKYNKQSKLLIDEKQAQKKIDKM